MFAGRVSDRLGVEKISTLWSKGCGRFPGLRACRDAHGHGTKSKGKGTNHFQVELKSLPLIPKGMVRSIFLKTSISHLNNTGRSADQLWQPFFKVFPIFTKNTSDNKKIV